MLIGLERPSRDGSVEMRGCLVKMTCRLVTLAIDRPAALWLMKTRRSGDLLRMPAKSVVCMSHDRQVRETTHGDLVGVREHLGQH